MKKIKIVACLSILILTFVLPVYGQQQKSQPPQYAWQYKSI
jgi:hypothetical protein